MNMTYEHKNAFTLIGYSTEIDPNEGYEKCPKFWEEAYMKRFAQLWQTMQPQNELEQAMLDNQIGEYAICVGGENGFAYWIAGSYKGGAVPEGLALYTFPESDWAIFSARGALPHSLQELNNAVWQEWYPKNGRTYEANGMAALEYYSAGDMQSADYECGIWVPIKRGKLLTNRTQLER